MASLSFHYFISTTEFSANLHGRVHIVFFPELSLLSKISFSLFPEIRYNLHYLFFCVLFICMLIYSYYCIFIKGLVNA